MEIMKSLKKVYNITDLWIPLIRMQKIMMEWLTTLNNSDINFDLNTSDGEGVT